MPTPAQADAIQSDVPADDAVESVAAVRSNREIAMEQIELANMRRMEEDSGVKLTADEPAPAPVDVPIEAPQPAQKVVTVKVDGLEKTITEDELIRSYQKNAAADRRLEEAAQLLRQANERADQLAAQVQVQAQIAEPPADVPGLRDEVKETLSVIYGGDEEAATEALTKLLTKNRGGDQPTPQVVQPNVDELAVAVQQRLEVDTAFAKLKTDYPDLIADPNLEMLTALKIKQAIAQGTPQAQAMLESADEIYRSLGKTPAGRQVDAPQPKVPNARMENKERLEPVRAASSSAVLPQVDAEEANPSSVIQEMAARRLGQSLPRRTG